MDLDLKTNPKAKLAPIAVFACRRPDHFKNLIASLKENKQCKDSVLFIFIGGPKSDADWPKVKETLAIAMNIDGFADVRIVELFGQLTGSGLIRTGVSTVLKEFERVIVLEDDLEVRCDFLLYMTCALDMYSHSENVAQVSGWSFGVISPNNPAKTYLFPITTSWGWGTWRRAWIYDFEVQDDLDWLVQKSNRIHMFNANENYNYLHMIERVIAEDYDAWDAVWYLKCFRNSKLIVYPNSSLVLNKGFDGSGLNFRRNYPWKSVFEESPQTVFFFPDRLELSKEYKRYTKLLRNWLQTFWPDSNIKFFLDKLKRKRRQHLNYFKHGYYSIFK
jgi:hypothetical protein